MMQESSTPIVAALDGLPLVLMTSEGGSQQEVWRSIELGAADCLEKPLSPLKLRNIWQHVVRKVSAPLVAPGRGVLLSAWALPWRQQCPLLTVA